MISSSLKQKIIFRAGEKNFRYGDVVEKLKEADIKKGDTIMVHADLAAFGKLGEINNKSDLADVFIDSFLEVLGANGTIIVPTFTYSFCNNETYDPDNSPSKVGLFSEEFRKRKDALRSLHPIFSVASIGKKAKELTRGLSKSSFYKGSIYDKLLKVKNAKYVIFGVNYFACTQIHYIEEDTGVPYRYLKKFKGKIKIKDKFFNDECEYYVRDLSLNLDTDFEKIEKHLMKKGLFKKIVLGCGSISIVKIKDIYREGKAELKKNPHFFTMPEKNK